MDRRAKDILKNAFVITEDSVEALSEVKDNIKKALESLLLPVYNQNAAQLKAAVNNAMNPMLSQYANASDKPFVESLQRIHHDVNETNKEMMKIQQTLTLLQGRNAADPKVKEIVDKQLFELNTLNEQYKKTSSLLQKQAMLLGDSNLADPKQKANLDTTIKNLHEQVNKLKDKAKKKNSIVEQVEEITRPKLGGRS